jgi:hypothetical protein
MTAAIFALVGTLVGALGTLAVELTRSRTEDVRAHREALRLACADFTAAIARTVNIALECNDSNVTQINLVHEAHLEARICYERLRLTAASSDIQKAGRYVLRYTFGIMRQVEGHPLRNDELERSPRMLLQDWLMVLYAEVRREIGVPQAKDIYREPDEWLGPSRLRSPKKETGTSS